jgi:sulfur-oxidizing protein SoxZ
MDTPNIPMRLNVTGSVSAGNTLAAVLLIGHPMESGYRTLDSGLRIAKNVITTIQVQLNGQALPAPLPPNGLVLSVNWVDDKGQRGEIKRELKPS